MNNMNSLETDRSRESSGNFRRKKKVNNSNTILSIKKQLLAQYDDYDQFNEFIENFENREELL